MLKNVVEKRIGKDWASISELVSARTKQQCKIRWHDILRSKTDETAAPVGKWTKEEDGKLRDAAEKYNGKNWANISELVPGRTKQKCRNRWVKYL
jgi:hypothetical protein